jgi:putative endonuclease
MVWQRLQFWFRRWREDRALLRLNEVHHPPLQRQWTKDDVGRVGELLAQRYLKGQGCKLLKCNFRCPEGGEADIVVRHGTALVFVEVKTRSEVSEVHRPRDAVNKKKRNLIRRASRSWRRMLRTDEVVYRYDIMEVLLVPGEVPELLWLKDAFQEQG